MQAVTKKTNYGPWIALVALVGVAVAIATRSSAPTPPAEQPIAAQPPQPEQPEQPVRYRLPVTSTQPNLGAPNALVTVVAWSDLRGPAARETDVTMHKLLAAHDGKLRWVHRGLILDADQESGQRVHSLARAAFQHAGKFWELRAALLAVPDDAPLDEAALQRAAESVGVNYADAIKAIDSGSLAPALVVDRVFRSKFGVTPPVAFFVNGMSVPLTPNTSYEAALEPVIEAELKLAEKLVATGVAPDKVYDTTIADGAWQVASASPASPESR